MWKNRELHPVSVREEQLPDRSKAQASPEPRGSVPWVGCVRPVDLQSSDRARFVNGSWDCPAVGYMACVGLAGRRDPQVGTGISAHFSVSVQGSGTAGHSFQDPWQCLP